MATVMKVDLQMKVQKDLNVHASFEHIVEDEDEARSLGAQANRLFTSWIEGYGAAAS